MFTNHIYLMYMCNVLQTAIDLMKENGFTLKMARSRWYPAETITDVDCIALLVNTPTWIESLLQSLEQAASSISLHVNTDKMEYLCFNQKGDISTLNGSSLKLVDKFTYLSSCFSSTENDINTCLAKALNAIDKLIIIWKFNLSNKIKCDFFQAAVISILLYGCTTWMLTKHIEKNLNRSCTRILQVVFNKSWKQHPTKQQLYGYLPPISKIIQIRQMRYVNTAGEARTVNFYRSLHMDMPVLDDQEEHIYNSSVWIQDVD